MRMNPNPPTWEMNVVVAAKNSDSEGMYLNRELLGLDGYGGKVRCGGYVGKARGGAHTVDEEYLLTVTGVKYVSRSPSRKASRRISTVRSNGLRGSSSL